MRLATPVLVLLAWILATPVFVATPQYYRVVGYAGDWNATSPQVLEHIDTLIFAFAKPVQGRVELPGDAATRLGRLIALNIFQLVFVSFMPFCSALVGEYGGAQLSQIVYSSNMVLLALFSWLMARHVYLHPELSSRPLSRGAYQGAQLRNGVLIAISFVAVGIGFFTYPAIGNTVYMLMAIVMPLSRRLDKRPDRAA